MDKGKKAARETSLLKLIKKQHAKLSKKQRAKPRAQTSKPSPQAAAYDIGTRHPRLEVLLDAYQATGNPLALWEAWRLCREHGLPVPPELLGYLDKVATALLDKKHARGKTGRAGDVAAKALKLNTGKKGGSSFRRHHETDRELAAVRHAIKLIEKGGTKRERMESAAEKFSVSYESVREWYYYWRPLLLK